MNYEKGEFIMEKQNDPKGVGIVYLILMLGNILVVAGGYFLNKRGFHVSLMLESFFCELFILIPVLWYLKSRGENIIESLGFHKIKISTVFLTVLLTIAVTPIFAFANILSQLFVSNILGQNSAQMADGAAAIAVTMIMTSIVAPIFEEVAFRGFFHNKIKGMTSVLVAAIISALMFGLMHLNLNQFSYAIILGFVFALANEASGSIWTSVIMHFLINFVNVSLVIIATLSLKTQDIELAELQEAQRVDTGAMLSTLRVYGVVSIVCVFLVWLLLKAIAKNQGNARRFKEAFVRKRSQVKETLI